MKQKIMRKYHMFIRDLKMYFDFFKHDMYTLYKFIRWIPAFWELHLDYDYRPDVYEYIIKQLQTVLTERTKMLSKPTWSASVMIAQLDKWYAEKWEEEESKPRGTYECFHCGHKSVVWDSDFDYSDYCYEGEGIVHSCHCANCGAEIEYKIRTDDPDSDTEETIEEN